MEISHHITFEFALALAKDEAINFVRDVERSLERADFIRGLERIHESDFGQDYIRANIPINAAMFGQHELGFQSLLIPTPQGAILQAIPFDNPQTAWAEVSGEAQVSALPKGSLVNYDFNIKIYLILPKAEKWGGRALMKMIEFTAQQVLSRIAEAFPAAIQSAAKEAEAKFIA
ncbi:MAG: DUF3809 domain-containing protein [Deinococcales bacterium]